MPPHAPVVRRVLLSSFLLSLSRAVIMPLLVLTLARQLGLSLQATGGLLGAVLLASALFGLYGGYWLDRLPRGPALRAAAVLMALGSVLLPYGRGYTLVVAALAAGELAMTLYGIAVKAILSDLVAAPQRARAFSLRYTLANVAWAVGPLLCSGMLMWRELAPFWLGGALALAGLLVQPRLPAAARDASELPDGFAATVRTLAGDRVLVWFTLSSLLAYVVYGRFSSYLPLYLLTRMGEAEAMRWMSALISCNAVVVVLLQYPLGRWLQPKRLVRAVVGGFLLIGAGMLWLGGVDSLPWMCAAIALFTLGEVVLVPAEYLYIDAIAPEALKGSYYGAQNLASLGGALGPALAGALLAHGPAWTLFASLALLCGLGAGLAVFSERLRLRRQDAGAAFPLPGSLS
ncbi:MFS transporter [Chromobacterium subtsugae]|uniref:MFS transporter n=1 Tax=Chromobacterium subtsugae TaxID=251747 RepID=A0ABS7F9G6_9NEIS|nr:MULTISPECIES: MFS transporter [Chromobacterium]MBW7565523.1 MFS transporter [Chromobacterium subtsugae]MBW8286627.1 MFS transporter [Chromobacterium subtsugae]WSE90892.1 MFS transporter [Chromobacterium subtsugae]WVH59265.1 MFS transporter [Chromobacterium subtsugae]